MFWGITLDAGKRYTQTVEKSFHLSMAALGFRNASNDPVTVMVEVDRAEFALCTLQAGKIPQQPLDYAFTEGEEITFYTEGLSDVHLTGYLVEEPETIEFDEADELSADSEESVSESGSEEGSDSSEDVTLQDLLYADNGIIAADADDSDEESEEDGEWDPSKDNPKPQKKALKKGTKRKRKATSQDGAKEVNGKEENGKADTDSGTLTLFADTPLLPSKEEDSEEYVPEKSPKKPKKITKKDKKKLFKKKGKS